MLGITPLTTDVFLMPGSLFLDNFATAKILGVTPTGNLVVYQFTNGLYAFLSGTFSTTGTSSAADTITGYAVKSSYAGITDVLLVTGINMSYSSFQSYTQSHTTSVMLDNWMTSGVIFSGNTKNLNSTLIKTGNGDDLIFGGGGEDYIDSAGGKDVIFAGAGNDYIKVGSGNDNIDGGAGIDIASFNGNRANYVLSKVGTTITVKPITGTDGTDALTNVERIQFSDAKLALDLDGNAGLTVKILGAVFGAASVSNKQFVGIGLSILDSGMNYSDLMALALNAAGAKTNDAVVTTLWTNVIGTAPTAADKAPFIDMLNNGMKAGDLGVSAANTSLNTGHINLVGLLQSGIEYV